MNAKIYFKSGKKILQTETGVKYDITECLSAFVDPSEEYDVFDDEYRIVEGVLKEFVFQARTNRCTISPMGARNRATNQGPPRTNNGNRGNRRQDRNQRRNGGYPDRSPAQAPYNFVGVSRKVTPFRGDKREEYGYIDFDMTTLTHTFIRGEGSSFYKEGERYAIPGSSIRGLLLTLCEILSASRFKSFDADRYMFDRRMDHNDNDILFGFLKKEGKDYFIVPCDEDPDQEENYAESALSYQEDNTVVLAGKRKGDVIPYWIFDTEVQESGKNIRFRGKHKVKRKCDNLRGGRNRIGLPVFEKGGSVYLDKSNNGQPGFLRKEGASYRFYACKHPVQEGQNDAPFVYRLKENQAVFSTGSVGGKTRMWIANIPQVSSEQLFIPKPVIRQYETDDMRSSKVPDILKSVKGGKVNKTTIPAYGLPIFYEVSASGEVDYISHCKLGRERFAKNYHEHLPADHRTSTAMDFVDRMFGSTEEASRIYIEPSIIQGEAHTYGKAVYTKMLLSPKPKSGKLYLRGNNGVPKWGQNDVVIRGHKLYWHRITPDDGSVYSWRESDDTCQKIDNNEGGKKKQYPEMIHPLCPGNTFKGRIRYEGISKEELGCLLWALQLGEGEYAHKIGLGKALGLGSVRMSNIKLTSISLEKRYASLFSTDSWNLGESDHTEQIKVLVDIFKKIVGEDRDHQERVKELCAMLTFDKEKHKDPAWLEKTRHLGFNDLKRRDSLPAASTIS